MKKITKIISFCLILCLLLSVFAACSVSKTSIVGTWICSLDGVTLESDGSYIMASMSYSGDITSAEFGNYVIRGNKVILKDSSTGKKTTFKYRNGKLICDGKTYKKS